MKNNRNQKRNNDGNDLDFDERSEDLRASPMMAYLLDAIEEGTDIGHYGRLVFAMVARHFMDPEQLVKLLSGQPDMDEQKARAMLLQVNAKDYNPPKRERILEWQSQQDFPICPTPDDPQSCNVYRELKFPEDIYSNITEFWEEKVEGEDEEK